jgi:hypothetical protein
MCILCCHVTIVLHEVSQFYYPSEAAGGTPMVGVNVETFCTLIIPFWPVASGYHYQHSCELTGVKGRGVSGGGSISAQGRWDQFSPLHNSKLLVLVIFIFYVIINSFS